MSFRGYIDSLGIALYSSVYTAGAALLLRNNIYSLDMGLMPISCVYTQDISHIHHLFVRWMSLIDRASIHMSIVVDGSIYSFQAAILTASDS